MKNDFISIQEAAELSKKSAQTIRRAIKSKKLKVKKSKTPQGFNYAVSQKSLFALYKLEKSTPQKVKKSKTTSRPTKQVTNQKDSKSPSVTSNELVEFHKTLQQLIQEHSQERQSYLRLIHTLQEKITVIENQFNLLKAANEKSWYQFWK